MTIFWGLQRRKTQQNLPSNDNSLQNLPSNDNSLTTNFQCQLTHRVHAVQGQTCSFVLVSRRVQMNCTGSGVRIPVSSLDPGQSDLTSLSFSCLICKMVIIPPASNDYFETEMKQCVRTVQYKYILYHICIQTFSKGHILKHIFHIA